MSRLADMTNKEATELLRNMPINIGEKHGFEYVRAIGLAEKALSVDWDGMIEAIKLESEESKNFIPKEYALWIELDDVIEIINKYRNGLASED